MQTENMNIIGRMTRSIFSFKSYPSLIRARGGKAALYSLILISLTYVCTFLIPAASVLSVLYGVDESVVNEYVPYFEIKDGVFSIEREVLYEDELGLSIIYATPDRDFEMSRAYDVLGSFIQGFIISPEAVIIKQTGGSVQSFPFSMYRNQSFSRDSLYPMIPILKVIVVALYFAAFFGYIAVYALGCLVCAMLASIVNLFFRTSLRFGELMKLTAYARTAPIIIKMICFFIPGFSLHFALFYALFIFYAAAALNAVRKESEPERDLPLEN